MTVLYIAKVILLKQGLWLKPINSQLSLLFNCKGYSIKTRIVTRLSFPWQKVFAAIAKVILLKQGLWPISEIGEIWNLSIAKVILLKQGLWL